MLNISFSSVISCSERKQNFLFFVNSISRFRLPGDFLIRSSLVKLSVEKLPVCVQTSCRLLSTVLRSVSQYSGGTSSSVARGLHREEVIIILN